MAHTPILEAFVKLGDFLNDFCENHNTNTGESFEGLKKAITKAEQQNGWFTQENIRYALKQWSSLLTEEKINHWLSPYALNVASNPKTVGIVMAGNIPLVGFHDFLCVLLTGNNVLVKLSSNDQVLLPFVVDYLMQKEPSFTQKITITKDKFEAFDAVIATGSNNTSRYFEYYFSKKPNIIRKNRSSVAILSGSESKEQLVALGEDIFRYFGLGCRNVSKVFVPRDYDFDILFDAFYVYKDIINHHKYANNYDYNKAVYLMSHFSILDNGFLILKEDESFSSPIASLFYEYYEGREQLERLLQDNKEDLQCIVSDRNESGSIPFGQTQKPQLGEYADDVDTMEFLLNL